MFDIEKETKVKEYINNYLTELKRHFDISDKRMRLILYHIYKDSNAMSKFKNFIKKHISVVKSFYRDKLKRMK